MGFFFDLSGFAETKETSGWNHLVEHLLFRGRNRDDRRRIAKAMDALGGEVNAYTEKEELGMTLSAPTDKTEEALTLLLEIASQKNLDKESVEREKRIVAQEIRMTKDDPEEWLWEESLNALYSDHFGMPVLGTLDSLRAVTADALNNYYLQLQEKTPKILCVTGNFDPKHVIEIARKAGLQGGTWQPRSRPRLAEFERLQWRKASTQFQLLTVLPFDRPLSSQESMTLSILAHSLGEANHSRLFQRVREEKGLCYQVYAGFHTVGNAGYFFFYGSTSPQKALKLETSLLHEWNKFLEDFSKQEWSDSLGSIMAQARLQADRLEARLDRIAGTWLQEGRRQLPEDYVSELGLLPWEGALDLLAEMKSIAPRIFSLGGAQA